MLFRCTCSRFGLGSDVAVVVEALGRLHGVSISAVAATIRANLRALLEANGVNTDLLAGDASKLDKRCFVLQAVLLSTIA